MKCTILASGSKGNCILVEGSGGALLVDAGLSAREILRRLDFTGGRPDRIQAILVTHEHGDHIRGVDVLSRRLCVPVHGTAGTLSGLPACRRDTGSLQRVVPCRYSEPFPVGDFIIEPFATSHDAAEPAGFTVRENGTAVGICTDTGVITDRMVAILARCDGIILESNHCPVMLKEGPYPESLKRRIRSAKGHLSNAAAAECLRRLGQDVPAIVLAHLSEVNNTPEKALSSARGGLGLLFGEVTVTAASQAGSCPAHPEILRL